MTGWPLNPGPFTSPASVGSVCNEPGEGTSEIPSAHEAESFGAQCLAKHARVEAVLERMIE